MSKDPSVLLVEDNAVMRHIALLNLRRFGIHADVAENGQEALSKFSQKKYDLILMDVAMPVMSGLTATERIRDAEKGTNTHVPIVGVTASETREKCLSAGMDDYIIKPPDYSRVLHRWLPQFFPSSLYG